MEPALERLNSTPYIEDEENLPVPSENLSDEIGDINLQRIETFVNEASVESDEGQKGPDEQSTITTNPQLLGKKENRAIATVPRSPRKRKVFTAIQSWEGYVIELNGEYFTARINDISCEHPDEEVEILLKDISKDDKKLIAPGAIFYWHVGHDTENGTTKRSSIIRFRRMPKWTKSDFDKADAFKTKLDRLF